MAEYLASLVQGNGTLALQSRYMPLNPPDWDDNVFKTHLTHRMDYVALGVIMCGDTYKKAFDGASHYDLSIKLDAMSPSGELWARFADVCSEIYISLSCHGASFGSDAVSVSMQATGSTSLLKSIVGLSI